MKQELISHFTWLANKLAEGNLYENWSDEFARKEVKEGFDIFYQSLQKESNKELIDFSNITKEDAIELRFNKWDEESNMYLIPLYLVPLIPKGTKLKCINGEETIFNDIEDINLDIRFGCIAWGIEIK